MPRILHVEHEAIPLDEENFLLIHAQWSLAFVNALAQTLSITLTPLHWAMITSAREHYKETGKVPTLKYLVDWLRKQENFKNLSSADLYHGFTEQPLKQTCQLAGLPKPPHCL